MKDQKYIKPTEAELEVLQVLWQEGKPCSVRFVHDALQGRKKDAVYTTTLKIMQKMQEKGLLHREGQGRKHLYSPTVTEADTQQKLLDRFMKTTFGGSAMKLVMQALGNHKASQEEIEKIRQLLDQKEGGKP